MEVAVPHWGKLSVFTSTGLAFAVAQIICTYATEKSWNGACLISIIERLIADIWCFGTQDTHLDQMPLSVGTRCIWSHSQRNQRANNRLAALDPAEPSHQTHMSHSPFYLRQEHRARAALKAFQLVA